MQAEGVTQEDFDHLQKQLQLLEGDRKAYFEVYEKHKRANESLVKNLRSENKTLRHEIAEKRKDLSRAQETGDESQEVTKEKGRMTKMRKEHDEVKHRTIQLKQSLSNLKDEFQELQMEARKPTREETPIARKIRMLENRLDKAMIKYNEAQSIRKTYEQILKRLSDERVSFDTQISAMERTLKARQRDTEELGLLSSDAARARDGALQELDRVKQQYREDVKWREREQTLMEEELKAARDATAKRQRRQRMRHERAVKAAQQKREAEEKEREEGEEGDVTQEGLQDAMSKIDVFEDAFQRIKEATGEDDVNEVVRKMVSQEDTQANLMEMTHENQAKIEHLLEQRTMLKERVDRLKYAGPGGRTGARKMVDEHEEQLASATLTLERARGKYERLAKALIQVKAGVSHLAEKLRSARGPGVPTPRNVAVTDESIVDVLYACEAALVALLAQVKEGEEVYGALLGPAEDAAGEQQQAATRAPRARRGGHLSAEGEEEGGEEEEEEGEEGGGVSRPTSAAADGRTSQLSALGLEDVSTLMQNRPFNRRINFEEDGEADAKDAEEEADYAAMTAEGDDDELTRDKVKQASDDVVMMYTRARRRKTGAEGAGASPGVKGKSKGKGKRR